MSIRSARAVLLALLSLLLCTTGVGAAPSAAVPRPDLAPPAQAGAEFSLTPIGSPIWKPVDIHLFTAPMGSGPDYREFYDTIDGLLAEMYHKGGESDAPPYDRVLAKAVASRRYAEQGQYTRAQFSAGKGVFLAWMMVPAPGITGSSPDFAMGPVIPRAAFPISVNSLALRDGVTYDPQLYKDEIAFNAPQPDGSSHFPIFIADNSDFGPPGTPVEGRYEYQVTLTDKQGQGWTLSAKFQVTP